MVASGRYREGRRLVRGIIGAGGSDPGHLVAIDQHLDLLVTGLGAGGGLGGL